MQRHRNQTRQEKSTCQQSRRCPATPFPFALKIVTCMSLYITASLAEIVQGPEDNDAPLNSVAVFTCTAAHGVDVIFWEVTTAGNTPYVFQKNEFISFGLKAFITNSYDPESTLEILATEAFEKAAIVCRASYSDDNPAFVSDTAILTVKGIGRVENLISHLQPPLISLFWDPPNYTSQDVLSVLYKLISVRDDAVVVLQQITSLNFYNTSYGNSMKPCHHYNFSVQAYSEEYVGEATITEVYLYGECAKIQAVECHVRIIDPASVGAFCNIQMTEQCQTLSLKVSLSPIGNTTANNITLTPALIVSDPNTVLNTIFLPVDEKYNVTARLSNDSGELIASEFTSISTFDIQGVSDPRVVNFSAVCLNASFANGSTANAFTKLTRIDDADFGHVYNATFVQNQQTRQASGCISVSRSGGNYSMSVYDEQNGTLSQKPAFVLAEPIEISPSPTSDPMSSPTTTPVDGWNHLLLIIFFVVIVFIGIIIIIIICFVCICRSRKRSKIKHSSESSHPPQPAENGSRSSSAGSNGNDFLNKSHTSRNISLQDIEVLHPHSPTHTAAGETSQTQYQEETDL